MKNKPKKVTVVLPIAGKSSRFSEISSLGYSKYLLPYPMDLSTTVMSRLLRSITGAIISYNNDPNTTFEVVVVTKDIDLIQDATDSQLRVIQYENEVIKSEIKSYDDMFGIKYSLYEVGPTVSTMDTLQEWFRLSNPDKPDKLVVVLGDLCGYDLDDMMKNIVINSSFNTSTHVVIPRDDDNDYNVAYDSKLKVIDTWTGSSPDSSEVQIFDVYDDSNTIAKLSGVSSLCDHYLNCLWDSLSSDTKPLFSHVDDIYVNDIYYTKSNKKSEVVVYNELTDLDTSTTYLEFLDEYLLARYSFQLPPRNSGTHLPLKWYTGDLPDRDGLPKCYLGPLGKSTSKKILLDLLNGKLIKLEEDSEGEYREIC